MRRRSWWRRLWQTNGTKGEESARASGVDPEADGDGTSRQLPERTLLIDALIDERLAVNMVAQLLWLESADVQAGITLRLDSMGGSVPAALAIHDALTYLRSPVSLVCTGQCGGAAVVLLACGRGGRRSMVEGGVVSLSPLRPPPEASTKPLRAQRDVRLGQHCLELLSLYTGQPMEQLQRDCEDERRFTAQQARDYGLIDHVLGLDG